MSYSLPKYVPMIAAEAERIGVRPGSVRHVVIAHDDWCDFLNGRGQCNCEPEVKFLPDAEAN